MKKIISIVVCAMLILLPFCFCASAATRSAEIWADDVTGVAGGSVIVPVKISDNSGFTYSAFTLNFDKSVLTYKGFYKGALNDYTVYDHSGDGRIAFAGIESGDNTENGTLICFEFDISKDAKEGTHKIAFSKPYFANEKGKRVKAHVTGGSLTVSDICDGGHSYSDWNVLIPATCKSNGIQVRSCKTCGHTESADIPATEHNVEKTFTVDALAKDGNPGMLSRHCTVCGAKTNVIVYTEENTTPLNINSVAENLDDAAIVNLVYFLNGEKTYPEIADDEFDIKQFTASDKSVRNKDGSINVDVGIDRLLRRLFGNDKKSGIIGAVKRAAIADEIPVKFIGKLIRFMFV